LFTEKNQGGKTMKKMRFKIYVLCFVFLFLGVATGIAADYPDRPIKVIIPYAGGGGAELLLRAFQPALEKELGQRILIESIGGGSTKVGTTRMIKSDPDGYTLGFTTPETWLSYYYSGVYDVKPSDQLVAIANVVSEPYAMIEVLADGPYKTFADLVRVGKQKGVLNSGAGGSRGIPVMIMDDIMKATGLNITVVPFDGSGPNKVALLGGHIDMRTCQPSEAIEMVRAGKTRIIAVSTEKRIKFFEDTPTFKELGVGGVMEMTRAFWGPPGISPAIVNKLTLVIKKAMNDPKFRKIAEEDFLFSVVYRSPEEKKADVQRFDAEWGAKMRETFKRL
jgi:tripartite-type tricarboxylate transporter receptor subunit TctC